LPRAAAERNRGTNEYFGTPARGFRLAKNKSGNQPGPSWYLQQLAISAGSVRSGTTANTNSREEVFHGQKLEPVGRNARFGTGGRRTGTPDGGFRRVRRARFRRAQRGAGATSLRRVSFRHPEDDGYLRPAGIGHSPEDPVARGRDHREFVRIHAAAAAGTQRRGD